MQEKENKGIEMDIKDIEIVRDSIGQIAQIGTKYNVPANIYLKKLTIWKK